MGTGGDVALSDPCEVRLQVGHCLGPSSILVVGRRSLSCVTVLNCGFDRVVRASKGVVAMVWGSPLLDRKAAILRGWDAKIVASFDLL